MTTTHVEALDADESVALFEQALAGDDIGVPAAVARLVPGLTTARTEPVPSDDTVSVTGARAVLLLGAARLVDGHGTLVPGDVLEVDPGATVTVTPSDDEHDGAVLLVLS